VLFRSLQHPLPVVSFYWGPFLLGGAFIASFAALPLPTESSIQTFIFVSTVFGPLYSGFFSTVFWGFFHRVPSSGVSAFLFPPADLSSCLYFTLPVGTRARVGLLPSFLLTHEELLQVLLNLLRWFCPPFSVPCFPRTDALCVGLFLHRRPFFFPGFFVLPLFAKF